MTMPRSAASAAVGAEALGVATPGACASNAALCSSFIPAASVLFSLGIGKLIYDIATKDSRVGTNTLLIFFAAFQVIGIGLLADLILTVSKSRVDIDRVKSEQEVVTDSRYTTLN